MAETFNNGESNASIRAKLNANAEEINDQAVEITALDTEKAPIANPTFTGTVSGVTKAMVGLSNVDNTADASKPVSTLQQNALDAKAPIASPTFTGTVGGITKSMVGLGSVDNTADASKPVSIAQAAAINARVPNTRTVNSKPLSTDITLDKTDIGLSNVDNTSDVNKPISALTSNALATKATPADIETALDDATIFFDDTTFEGAVYPIPTEGQPAVGTEGNPIKAVGSGGGVVVDIVEVGNSNAVSSNAVAINFNDVKGGYSGSLQDLYDLITSGLPEADAPTDFIVDDVAKTADFTFASGFTDLSDYEYQINGGTITTLTAKPLVVGNVDAAIGAVKIRTKAVLGVSSASTWLTNPTAYTFTPTGGDYMTDFIALALDNGIQDDTKPISNDSNGTWNTTYSSSSFVTAYSIPVGAEVACKLVTGNDFILGIGYDSEDLFNTSGLNWNGTDGLRLKEGGDYTTFSVQPVIGDFLIFKHHTDGTMKVFYSTDGVSRTEQTVPANLFNLTGSFVAGKIEGIGSTLSFPQGKDLVIV